MISKQPILVDKFMVSLLQRTKSKISIDSNDERIRDFKVAENNILHALRGLHSQSSRMNGSLADYMGECKNGW